MTRGRPLVDPLWAETVDRCWLPDDWPEEYFAWLPEELADVMRRRCANRWGQRESRRAIGERLGVSVSAVEGLENRARDVVMRRVYELRRGGARCPHCSGTGWVKGELPA